VPISITRHGDLYAGRVTPPHGGGKHWSSSQPVSAKELIEKLQSLGCHTTDIGDAFYAADPIWLTRSLLDAE
jgi:hypothetical protein